MDGEYKAWSSSMYSFNGNYLAGHLFDYDTSAYTLWASGDNTFNEGVSVNPDGEFVAIMLPTNIRMTSYSITSRKDDSIDQSFKSWYLEASNDEINWDLLDTQTSQTGWSVNETRTYNVSSAKSYQMFRWRVIENNGSVVCSSSAIELNGYQVESVGDPAGVSFSGEIVAGEGAQTTYYAMAFADPTLSRDYVVTQMVSNNYPNAMIGDTAIASDQTYALSNQLLANVVDGLGATIPAALVNNATVYLYAVDTLGNKDMQVVSVLPAFDSVPRVTMASLTVNPNNIVVTGGSVYSCNGVITKVYQPWRSSPGTSLTSTSFRS